MEKFSIIYNFCNSNIIKNCHISLVYDHTTIMMTRRGELFITSSNGYTRAASGRIQCQLPVENNFPCTYQLRSLGASRHALDHRANMAIFNN